MTKWTVLAEQMALPPPGRSPSPDHRRHVPRPPYRPASHDDATEAHVAESHQLGSVIAEFPTTPAAQASRHRDARPDGAPNIVRGGSHRQRRRPPAGEPRFADILSSDYYPASLLDAARIADAEDNAFTLPQAIRLVSQHPAQALALTIAASSPRENAPTGAGAPSRRTYPDRPCLAPGRGSFNAGKLIWLVGPPAPVKIACWRRRGQREHPQLLVAHRYITRRLTRAARIISPQRTRVFYPRRAASFALQLARQQYLLWHWRGDRPRLHAGFDVVANGSAPTWRWPGTLRRGSGRSVSPSRRRCCASGWSSAAGKTRWKSPSVWNARAL